MSGKTRHAEKEAVLVSSLYYQEHGVYTKKKCGITPRISGVFLELTFQERAFFYSQ